MILNFINMVTKRLQWDHGPGNTLYAHIRMYEQLEDKKIAC